MTLEDIANLCRCKSCEVALGDPAVGYIRMDGMGPQQRSNYRRYLDFHELAARPAPADVLEKATTFEVRCGEHVRTLTREAFEKELDIFRRKTGI